MTSFSNKNHKKWTAFEHKMWQICQNYPILKNSSLLLLVSGGKDSVGLLHSCVRLAPAMNWHLEIFHAHHGGSSFFRNESQKFVESLAKDYQLPFHLVKSENDLQSEQEMRFFRYHKALDLLKKLQDQTKKKIFLVTAHHSNDLLETRLMRLIRGTGLQGFTAMKTLTPFLFRPLLSFSSQEIEKYVNQQNLKYLEDPSNQNTKYFRNWIRHVWLKELENKYPGASKKLSHSLNILAETLTSFSQMKKNIIQVSKNQKMLRFSLIQWRYQSTIEQKRIIAEIFSRLHSSNYTQGQIEEVWKFCHHPGTKSLPLKCGQIIWYKKRTWLYARNPI